MAREQDANRPRAIDDSFVAITVIRWAWRDTGAPPDVAWIATTVCGGDVARAERLLYVALQAFGINSPVCERAVPLRFRAIKLPDAVRETLNENLAIARGASEAVAQAAVTLMADMEKEGRF
jgi:hypothetical protein